ncbi:hypothetical protein TNCV_2195891 [Trichonephila clavipes]|nr:hypothetical protein TNCV_2195891 [Trichonephila clavipes]
MNVVTDCKSLTGTPPIKKNAEARLIFSFEQKQKGVERGFRHHGLPFSPILLEKGAFGARDHLILVSLEVLVFQTVGNEQKPFLNVKRGRF